MPLNHHKLLDWFGAYSEVERGTYRMQVEKHGAEVILYSTRLFLDRFTPVLLVLFNLEQCLTRRIMLIHVSYLEVYEFDLGLVSIEGTKVTFCWDLEVTRLFDGYVWVHLKI
jgi:hypothetical protein